MDCAFILCTVRLWWGGQDRLHRDLRVIGLVDQTVVRLDARLVALSGAAERAPWHLAQRVGELGQSLVHAPVPQVRACKLAARPIVAVQAFGDIARHHGGHCGRPDKACHSRAHRRVELIDIDRLDRFRVQLEAVLPAATSGLADLQPVRCPVAGTDEVLRVDKALHQPGAITILGLVISTHAPQDHPQHVRSQVLAAHRVADEKPTHADDAIQMLATRLDGPADPLIAIGQLQRRRPEAQAAQPAMLGADQIAHLRAHQGSGALRVLAQHQLVPHPHQVDVVDDDQRQPANLTRLRRHVDGKRHRLTKTARGRCRADLARHGRQHKVAGALEFAQRLDAASGLRALSRIKEAEVSTHRLGNRAPVLVLRVRQ